MSLRKLVLTALIGFSLGGAAVFVLKDSARLRSPASSQASPPKLWAHSLSGKMNQVIEVSLSPLGGVPDNDNQELRLRAEVMLHRPPDQEVKFQWNLPPGASVVSGELEDAWPNLQAGQTASTEIALLGVSKESVQKTVTLHVSALSQGVTYSSAGSFATNSAEQMAGSESIGVMKVHNSQLGLKNPESPGKLKRVQQ